MSVDRYSLRGDTLAYRAAGAEAQTGQSVCDAVANAFDVEDVKREFCKTLFPAVHFGGVVIAVPMCARLMIRKDLEMTTAEELAEFENGVNDSV